MTDWEAIAKKYRALMGQVGVFLLTFGLFKLENNFFLWPRYVNDFFCHAGGRGERAGGDGERGQRRGEPCGAPSGQHGASEYSFVRFLLFR